MAKDLTLYPVSKGDSNKYFGDADAGQIAASKGKLKLFDPEKAKAVKQTAAIKAEEKDIEQKTAKVEAIKASGGSDAGAVRKGPASK